MSNKMKTLNVHSINNHSNLEIIVWRAVFEDNKSKFYAGIMNTKQKTAFVPHLEHHFKHSTPHDAVTDRLDTLAHYIDDKIYQDETWHKSSELEVATTEIKD